MGYCITKKRKDYYKKTLLDKILFSSVYSLMIVSICLSVDINFFNIDDAINECIGYYTQIGRIISTGNFPFIVDYLFIGGNSLVELSKNVFAPQSIIASLLAWNFENKQIIGIFLAFFNLFIINISCLYIAQSFNIRKIYMYAFCAFYAIQPVFLFIYCRSWWIGANGTAWSTACIAIFLSLYKNIRIKKILLLYISTAFLFLTYWTFSILFYFIFSFILIMYKFKKNKGTIFFIALSIITIFFVIPFYSEYIYNSDLHQRFNIVYNDNMLVPSLSSFFTNYFPAYFDYIKSWGNYSLLCIPLAFSTIFLPVAILKKDLLSISRDNKTLKSFYIILLLYTLLSQLPANFFSIRWPFRMLPATSFIICLISFFVMSKSDDNKKNIKILFFLTLYILILAIERIVGQNNTLIYIQLITFILLFFIYATEPFLRSFKFYYVFTAVLTLIIFLFSLHYSGDNFLPKPALYDNFNLPSDYNTDGYSFKTGELLYSYSPDYSYLSFARGGIHNLKTINGYTPLGYKNLANYFPGGHGSYDTKHALDRLLSPIGDYEICRAKEWRISTFILPENDAKEFASQLSACGYSIGKAQPKQGFTYASLTKDETKGWDSLPPFAIPPLEGIKQIDHTNNSDTIYIPPHDKPILLIFPRLYWHGYTAYMDNEELTVNPDDTGFLTSVTIPEGFSGKLHLSFFPTTWRYLWWLPILSIFCLVILCILIHRLNKIELNINNLQLNK